MHREIENCVDARRGKEPSKVMSARHISSAGERKKKDKTEEAGAESWHPQTRSREGASNEPEPGPNLETEAEKRHLTAMPEASSNRGH